MFCDLRLDVVDFVTEASYKNYNRAWVLALGA